MSSCRDEVLRYALKRYGTEAEHLWLKFPEYAVLRHKDNKKWYALIMDVPREKLGLSGGGNVDIMEIKCDPLMGGSLRAERGILPAYHMHRGNWVTVLLDGSVERDALLTLLDMSYDRTAGPGSRGRSGRPKNQEQRVPVNPKYFDPETAAEQKEDKR